MAEPSGDDAGRGPRPRGEPYLLPERIAPVRSLRVKVLLVVAAVAFLPELFVLAWSLMERNIGGEMTVRVAFAAEEAAKVIAEAGTLDLEATGALEQIARIHGLRLRLLRQGVTVFDVDEDRGTDLVHRIGMLFFGPDGAPTLAEFDVGLGPVGGRPEIVTALARGGASGCSPPGKLLVCHGVRALRGVDGTFTVIYAQESSRRAVRALYDLRYQLLRLSVITLPLALLLALWMGKRVVGPLEALRRQAQAIARGRGGARLAVRGQDEITDLADAFDTLLQKLEHRQGENERFVADLVHELKNPVAAVRTAAEVLGGGPVDEARSRRLSRALLDASARLDALVSQFLELARAEAGLAADERADVDVAAVARGLSEAARARFEGVEIEVRAEGTAVVRAVPHGVDGVLRNLIENAASFAEPRGEEPPRVLVEVEALAERVVVRVTDSGPGIAGDELEKVWARFYTRRRGGHGTGLGLPLVRATAEAHGGSVGVRSAPGEGATFEVSLPRAG